MLITLSMDCSVSNVASYGLDDGLEFFSSPSRLDRLWGLSPSSSLPFNWYDGLLT